MAEFAGVGGAGGAAAGLGVGFFGGGLGRLVGLGRLLGGEEEEVGAWGGCGYGGAGERERDRGGGGGGGVGWGRRGGRVDGGRGGREGREG